MSNGNDKSNIEKGNNSPEEKKKDAVPAEGAKQLPMSEYCNKRRCSNYRNIFLSAIDVMVISDLKGKIVDINPAVYKQFGYLPSELIGKSQNVLFPEENREQFEGLVKKLKNEERPKGELTGLKKDGNTFDTEVRGIPFDFLSNPHILTIIRDISDRKRAQQAIENGNNELKKVNKILNVQNRALYNSRIAALKLMEEAEKSKTETEKINKLLKESSEKAMQATKAKSEFLANTSHEIRTPMNSIIGFSDLLAEEDLSKTQQEYVNTIRRSGENLLEIINDILDFSKIEAGELAIEKIPTQLSEIVSNIETLIKPMAENKGLEFKVIVSSDIPKIIETDPVRLRQCFINLLTNSIKFTESGHVYLKISLDKEGDIEMIRYDVEDTGIGIPGNKQQKIFDSFSQADGSTTRKFGGTGLGLAITNNLVNLMHGEINVKSEVGKGSVFSILLPLDNDMSIKSRKKDKKVEQNMNGEQPKSEDKLTGNILVAEDNPSNQMLVKILLEKLGVEATIVEDGQQAVDAVCSGSYDMILMDMQMPRMNGYEATEALRKKGIDLPIIALTANAMKGDSEKCKEAGCNDYMPKPVNKAELSKMLKTYLNSESNSSTSTPTPSIVNDDSTELKSNLEGDPSLTPVINVFVDDLPQILSELETAIGESDIELLKTITHRLKGASLSAGFDALSERITSIEDTIIKDDLAAAKDCIDELNDICRKVIDRQKSK